jgi:alpha-L-fucosidase
VFQTSILKFQLIFFILLSSPAFAQHAPPDKLHRWQDAKFGLFVHFGPWSQTSSGLIWPLATTDSETQRKQWFALNQSFNPTGFNPDEWSRIAKESGAKYVVFTTKHHDGFCNFDTAFTDYRITAPSCPYSRSEHPDITAALVKSLRARDLMVGLYYSHIDWHHPDGGWFRNTAVDETFVGAHPDRWKRFAEYESNQVTELLTRYGPIDILWFDVRLPKDASPDARQMLARVRQLQPGILLNDRGTLEFGDFVTPEQGIPNPLPQKPWETCITITQGNGFWYKGENAQYKSTADLIRLLCDVASKGGNLLLNVGPRPDGTFTRDETQRLLEMGDWLRTNGPAVYETTASPLSETPAWGRITRKGTSLFCIIFTRPPPGSPLHIKLPYHVNRASPLGPGASAQATPDGFDVSFSHPDELPPAIRVDVDGISS